jgi:hypothetical protein
MVTLVLLGTNEHFTLKSNPEELLSASPQKFTNRVKPGHRLGLLSNSREVPSAPSGMCSWGCNGLPRPQSICGNLIAKEIILGGGGLGSG